MLFLILVAPGLAVVYALLLRPLLHKVTAFQAFYAKADGFWASVWAHCGHSVTIAWGYLLAGIGTAFGLLDPVAKAVGDPDLKTQVTDALQSNPKILGYILAGISAVTIAARIRSLVKG